MRGPTRSRKPTVRDGPVRPRACADPAIPRASALPLLVDVCSLLTFFLFCTMCFPCPCTATAQQHRSAARANIDAEPMWCARGLFCETAVSSRWFLWGSLTITIASASPPGPPRSNRLQACSSSRMRRLGQIPPPLHDSDQFRETQQARARDDGLQVTSSGELMMSRRRQLIIIVIATMLV